MLITLLSSNANIITPAKVRLILETTKLSAAFLSCYGSLTCLTDALSARLTHTQDPFQPTPNPSQGGERASPDPSKGGGAQACGLMMNNV